jgi:hypothetical protein
MTVNKLILGGNLEKILKSMETDSVDFIYLGYCQNYGRITL